MKPTTLKENNMNTKGRGWQPVTELQVLLFNTYTNKKTIANALNVSQPTLKRLLNNEDRLSVKQLFVISKDSNTTITQIISMI
jgi:transcriptional regulator with XRE-family HTH domain